MVDSIGKKLQQARQRRQMSVEDASHATRIPAGRLTDLEREDFSGFPNLAYAKAFLVLYARHLGVDVTEYLEVFDGTGSPPAGAGDLGVLKRIPVTEYTPPARRQKKPSVVPAIALFGVALVAVIVWLAVVTLNRLGLAGHSARKPPAITAQPVPEPGAAPPVPAPAATAPVETPRPLTEPSIPESEPAAPLVAGTAAPGPTPAADPERPRVPPDEPIEIRRAIPVNPRENQ